MSITENMVFKLKILQVFFDHFLSLKFYPKSLTHYFKGSGTALSLSFQNPFRFSADSPDILNMYFWTKNLNISIIIFRKFLARISTIRKASSNDIKNISDIKYEIFFIILFFMIETIPIKWKHFVRPETKCIVRTKTP